MQPKTVGQRIRDARESKGLKPADLARAAGVTSAAVSQWESDATKNIRPTNLFDIAEILGKNPKWIITGEGPEDAVGVAEAAPRYGAVSDEGARFARLWETLPEVMKIQVRAFLEVQHKLLEEYPDLFVRSDRERQMYDKIARSIKELKAAEKRKHKT